MKGTYGEIAVKVTVDKHTVTLTNQEGESWYFEHDCHLPGSGEIQGIEGDISKLIDADLYVLLRDRDKSYAWEFHHVNGGILASVRWDGAASGYYGMLRTRFPCLPEEVSGCTRCHFVKKPIG